MIKIFLLTTLAMIAFAANSVLCRIALGNHEIDAASFTSIRMLSGAITLAILLWSRRLPLTTRHINIQSSLALFIYAICFSFAYIGLSTGSGALILFGTVQLTMIGFGLFHGEKPGALTWSGILLASGGLVYLMLPGVDAPSFTGALLMACAGLAWGVYSLRGKSVANPVAATAWNFIGTVPFAIITSLIFISSFAATPVGIVLAILSGSLASGVGYVIWYAALPHLSWTSAAIIQLSVPMIAAFGGVLFMSELITMRLLVASAATLGGIALVIYVKKPKD